MVESDRQEFVRIMHKLAEVFPRKLTDSLMDSYWSALTDWPIGRVVGGFKYINDTRTERKFPVPGEVYRAILQAAKLSAYNPELGRQIER